MFPERGFPSACSNTEHMPPQIPIASRLCVLFLCFVSFMFHVLCVSKSDPREADKDKVRLQFYLISSKTLLPNYWPVSEARTPQPLIAAHSHRSWT